MDILTAAAGFALLCAGLCLIGLAFAMSAYRGMRLSREAYTEARCQAEDARRYYYSVYTTKQVPEDARRKRESLAERLDALGVLVDEDA